MWDQELGTRGVGIGDYGLEIEYLGARNLRIGDWGPLNLYFFPIIG